MLTEEEKEEIRQKVNGMCLSVGLGHSGSTCSIGAINLALDNRRSDAIPYCMSEVIGAWIVRIQDAMPSGLRNSERWKSLLPDAAGTGRAQEDQRFDMLLDWMWNTVLPVLQPIADRLGFGSAWLNLTESKNCNCAALALRDAALTMPYRHASIDVRLIELAENAADYARLATNPYFEIWYRSRVVAGVAVYVKHAVSLSSPDTDVVSIWETIDPCGLLERLIKLEPSKGKQDAK